MDVFSRVPTDSQALSIHVIVLSYLSILVLH